MLKATRQKGGQMSKLDDVLLAFRNEIDGFVSTDVVNISDGMSIGGGSIMPNFDSTAASAEFASVTQAVIRALKSLGNDYLEDILITTSSIYVIVRMLGPSTYYHGLAINKNVGNLGRSRLIMKNYELKIIESMPI
jgi:predicted regulator of Ras-like GTPase activity (Roadblock/LC7/MglB family)